MRTTSRCTVPVSPPLLWHDYVDVLRPDVVEFDGWLSSLPDVVREVYEGEIDALHEMAADGEIDETDDQKFEPVQRFPDIFELKWRFRRPGSRTVHLRQYHAEPSELPRYLIKLHLHLKDTSGPKQDVRDRQNQQMAYARLRFVAGQSANWDV